MLPAKLWGQRARSAARAYAAFALSACALSLVHPSTGAAQTWTAGRVAPPLYHIIAIDRTGEPVWPYGREDVAGDGLDTYSPAESATDLRTVYADADAARLFLRAYVVADAEPGPELLAFFFLDVDDRAGTGGRAQSDALSPFLPRDRSGGGYERAIAIDGVGMVRGIWEWNGAQGDWVPLAAMPPAVRGERGRAPDPLGFGANLRGYVQVDLEHGLSGLSASCSARILVRLVRSEGAVTMVDDALDDAACRAPSDNFGDPVIVRDYRCESDLECPAAGRCRDGLCLFAYQCGRDEDCRGNERCTDARCVRVVDRGCTSSAECDGLVCEAGRCVPCSEGGTRACGGGTYCSPNGACADPDDFSGGSLSGRVQGGAFHCAAGGEESGFALLGVALLGLTITLRRGARREP